MEHPARHPPSPAPKARAATPAAGDDAVVAKRPRGRPRKSQDALSDGNRRDELISAAARLFRRKGFDATSTRDIAAAVGMRSGSPFYHFKSKGALLNAVMEEGMRSALERQRRTLQQALHHAGADQPGAQPPDPRMLLSVLIRHHFGVLLGASSDFIPVMLYEWRSLTPRQRAVMAELQGEYEAAWIPVLEALHARGLLKPDVKLARLFIFGALNWSAQWYDRRRQGASLDDLTRAAMALFIHETT